MVVVTQIVKKEEEEKRGEKERKKERNTTAYSTRELCARAHTHIRSRHCPVNENEWTTGTT